MKLWGGFVAERVAAQSAVGELPDIGREDRAALFSQVLHDTVPAQLVPAMGKALARVGEGAVVLGPGLKTADAQKKIAAIRDAMSDAFTEAGFEVNVNNQDEVHRQFWRFLLAPAGAAGIQAVAEGVAAPRRARCGPSARVQAGTGENSSALKKPSVPFGPRAAIRRKYPFIPGSRTWNRPGSRC